MKQDKLYISEGGYSGRVKLSKTSEEAVIRETFEETSVKFEIDRLAFIHEHFLTEEVTREYYHEISFFYLMKSPVSMNFNCNSIGEQGAKEHLYWLPIEDLNAYHLYPEFLKLNYQRV